MTVEVAVFSFRHTADKKKLNEMKEWCKEWGKNWVFQKESSDTGYVHYQGRISLKKKRTVASAKKVILEAGFLPEYFEPECNVNCKGEAFYVTKKDTRIEGPWSDKDEVLYIPRQIREITALKPWQQYIVDHGTDWDTRHINILWDPHGSTGKSTIKTYIRAHKLGRFIPFVNDYKDMMRIIMDCDKEKLYIIDIPRAIQKDRLYQFYAGIETLKDGYAYDDRYHFRDEVFDCPNIWVFTNVLPETSFLSLDRWVFWTIVEDNLERISLGAALEKH